MCRCAQGIGLGWREGGGAGRGAISVRSHASLLVPFRQPYCFRTCHLRGFTFAFHRVLLLKSMLCMLSFLMQPTPTHTHSSLRLQLQSVHVPALLLITYIHTHTHIYIYIYTCMHACTHTYMSVSASKALILIEVGETEALTCHGNFRCLGSDNQS